MKKLYQHILCLILLMAGFSQAITAQQNYLEFDSEVTTWDITHQARDSIRLKDGFLANPTGSQFLKLCLGLTTIQPTTYLAEAPDPNTRELDKTREVGSIQGNFNVTPTGAATYSIPIKVPKGTGSMMPGLSVGYNSQSGDGLLGTKWSLGGISMITRAPNDAYHDECLDPIDFDGDDHYVWNGQYLVWDHDDTNGDKIYRTEQESWAEIRAVGNSGDGPLYWQITTKDGLLYFYGYSEDSRHQEQNSASVLRWIISKVKDPYSNYMKYYYHEDQANGEAWIDRIEYTGNMDENTDPYNTVKFNYSERTDKRLHYIGGSAVRSEVLLDNITSYTDNEFVKSYNFRYVYEDYVSKLVEIEEVGTFGEKYNTTIVDWGDESEPVYFADTLSNTQEMARMFSNGQIWNGVPVVGDFTGDGLDDIYWYYVWYDQNSKKEYAKWYRLYKSNGIGFTLIVENALNLEEPKFTAADFNGDGKMDLLQRSNAGSDHIQVDLNISHGTNFTWYDLGTSVPFFYNIEDKPDSYVFYAFDVTSDGRADLITEHYYIMPTNHDTITSIKVTEFDVDNNYSELLTTSWFWNNQDPCIVEHEPYDVNGNGTPDLIVYTEDINNQYCYTESFKYIPSSCSSFIFVEEYPTKTHEVWWGNFNGDRYADVMTYVDTDENPDLWEQYFYTGKTGTYNDVFSSNNICPLSGDFTFDNYDGDFIKIVDLNGDGLDDILEASPNTVNNTVTFKYHYRHSTGFYNGEKIIPYYSLYNMAGNSDIPTLSRQVFTGDFNGDGSNDICLLSMNIFLYNCYFVYGKNESKKMVVDTICNGMNQKIAIETAFGTQDDELCSNPASIDYPLMPFNGKTLLTKKSYLQIDDVNWNETQYTYRNGRIHLGGKGFLGFGEVQIDNLTTDFRTKTRYTILDDVLVPVPTWQENKGPNGQLLSLTTNTYDLIDHSTAADYSIYSIRPNTIDQCDVLHGNIHQITKYVEFDTWGNAKIVTNTNSEVSLSTNISYTYANTPFPSKPQNITKTYSRIGEVDLVTTESIDYNSFGTASSVKVNESFGKLGTQTYYTYDNYGNVVNVQTKDLSNDPKIKTKTYGWDDDHKRFVVSSTNDLGYITKSKYNNRLGVIEEVEDKNGLITKYTYNGLGRKLMEVYPDGNNSSIYLSWNNASCEMPGTTYHIKSVDNAGTVGITYYDQFGRSRFGETKDFNGSVVLTKREYDALGRAWRSWEPWFENESPELYTETTYDYLQRIDKIKNCMSTNSSVYALTDYDYGSNSVTTTYTSGSTTRTKTVVKNDAGEVISSTDAGGTITYDHYSNGLTKSISYDGLTTLLEYDINGNRTKITDPDAGIQQSEYNAYNELVTSTDAEANVVSYTFDELGRVKTRIEPEGVTTWNYSTTPGRLGTLESIIAPSNSIQYVYDDLLRVTKETTTIDNESFEFRFDYDIFGRQCGMTFPSGYHINTEYNSNNYMSQIVANNNVVIHKPSTYNARGQITATHTNGEWETNYRYDDYGMLYSKEVRDENNGSYMIQDDNYNFNHESGNLDTRSNMYSQSETFGYDDLNRLTSELINTTSNSASYYTNGNINTKTDVGTYIYDPTSKPPHAVHQVTNPYTYAPSIAQNIDYTSYKKVSQIEQGYDKYNIWYDHNRNRIKSELLATNMTKGNDVLKQRKYYLGNYEEEIKPDGSKRMLHYIGGESGTAAVYVLHSTGEDTLYSVFTDHLGSWKTVINETTLEVYHQSFDAWGRKRNPQNWNSSAGSAFPFDRGYTGHQHLDEFGLINMNGRMYDAGLCRFLSPDPYVQAPDFTQNFNRYSYCLNNPLVYTDPSGEIPILIPIIAGAVIGGYLGGSAAEGWKMNPGKWAWDGDTWAGIGIGVVIGALGGYGFCIGAPALASTGFFAHFGTSGTVTAYTLTGGVAGGIIGYGSGFAGGMLYSNGDWEYSHQSGIYGAKIGATIGTVAGAIAGNIESYEPPKSPPQIEMPDRPKWDGPYFLGTEEEAKNMILTSSKLFNVETSYWSTSKGYYFAPIQGYAYGYSYDPIRTTLTNNNLEIGYKVNTIKSTYRYTYVESSGGSIYLYPKVFYRSRVYYKAHTHPRSTPPGAKDLLFSYLFGIRGVVYGWNGSVYKYGGQGYWK